MHKFAQALNFILDLLVKLQQALQMSTLKTDPKNCVY